MNSRKLWACAIIIISACISLVVCYSQFSSETISNWDSLYISDKDFSAFSTSSGLQATPLTTEVYFNDEKLIYDSEDNTFYYSLIEDDQSAFTPLVEIPDSNISLAVYGSAISEESIAANTPLQLILLSGNNVSISNLICTTLPVMNVDISEDILSQGGYDDTYDILEDTPSSIYLYDNRADFDGATRSITSDSKIRRRGQTNAVNPAKSYRISLIEDKNDLDSKKVKENLLGLREDDDWILYSPYSDYEKVRNVFSMNLWYDSFAKENEWSVTNGTQYKFVELFINNHYHGLYGLCYPIDKKQVDLKDGETLFKKMDWTHSERNIELDYQEYPDGSGGEYVLGGYSIKGGSEEDAYNDLLSLYVNLNYSTEPAAVRLTSDVTNGIDLWLYYKLTQAVDNMANGGVKNMYVTVKNSDSGIDGHKLLITPWDMDQSWRYVAEGVTSQYSNPAYDMPVEWGTVCSLQLLGDPTINQEIKDRYTYLRQGPWSTEAILASLDEYEKDIYGSGAFVRTQNRWPAGLYNDSSLGLSEFKDYVVKRFECMDEYVEGLQ